MIKAILALRVKQLLKIIRNFGLFRILIILAFLIFVFAAGFKYLAEFPTAYYIIGIFIYILVHLQLSRQDILFLIVHCEQYKKLLFLEYFILSVPLLTGLIYYQYWYALAFVISILILLVNFNFKLKKRTRNSYIIRLIGSESFEIIAGLRKFFIFYIILILTAVCTFFNHASIPVVILIIGVLPISFYEQGEPISFLFIPERNSREFLFMKVIKLISFQLTIMLPLCLLYQVFNFDLWYIPVVEIALFINLCFFVVYTKYAFYLPGKKSIGSQIFYILGVVSTIIPFLLPIMIGFSIYFYQKAIHNLNFYLNDYN